MPGVLESLPRTGPQVFIDRCVSASTTPCFPLLVYWSVLHGWSQGVAASLEPTRLLGKVREVAVMVGASHEHGGRQAIVCARFICGSSTTWSVPSCVSPLAFVIRRSRNRRWRRLGVLPIARARGKLGWGRVMTFGGVRGDLEDASRIWNVECIGGRRWIRHARLCPRKAPVRTASGAEARPVRTSSESRRPMSWASLVRAANRGARVSVWCVRGLGDSAGRQSCASCVLPTCAPCSLPMVASGTPRC